MAAKLRGGDDGRGEQAGIRRSIVRQAQLESKTVATQNACAAHGKPRGMTRPATLSAPADRLRQARERAGFSSASEFARHAQVNYTTYAHHENGRREIKPETARLYARLLSLPAGNLLYGEETPSLAPIPVVGIVRNLGRCEPIADKNGRRDTVTLPDPVNLVALQIVGDDLYPAYRDGDIVFHRPLSSDRFDPVAMNGIECVVRLPDGRMLLRTLTAQADGRYTLSAYHAPPMINQHITAVAPVEIVQRHVPSRLNRH